MCLPGLYGYSSSFSTNTAEDYDIFYLYATFQSKQDLLSEPSLNSRSSQTIASLWSLLNTAYSRTFNSLLVNTHEHLNTIAHVQVSGT